MHSFGNSAINCVISPAFCTFEMLSVFHARQIKSVNALFIMHMFAFEKRTKYHFCVYLQKHCSQYCDLKTASSWHRCRSLHWSVVVKFLPQLFDMWFILFIILNIVSLAVTHRLKTQKPVIATTTGRFYFCVHINYSDRKCGISQSLELWKISQDVTNVH